MVTKYVAPPICMEFVHITKIWTILVWNISH